MKLKQLIEQTNLTPGELAVFYLAQAGFYFKTSDGKTVCIDPYLSNCCERMFGFKRMVPNVLKIAEFTTDILVSTHSHADHLDPDLLETISGKEQIRFVGSTDCREVYETSGIAQEQFTVLSAGQSANSQGC